MLKSNHAFNVLDKDRVTGLINRLHTTGARQVWATDIQRSGLVYICTSLLVELPEDADQRAALFMEEALFHKQQLPITEDTGQRILKIELN